MVFLIVTTRYFYIHHKMCTLFMSPHAFLTCKTYWSNIHILLIRKHAIYSSCFHDECNLCEWDVLARHFGFPTVKFFLWQACLFKPITHKSKKFMLTIGEILNKKLMISWRLDRLGEKHNLIDLSTKIMLI
jgi:hypothetical protein